VDTAVVTLIHSGQRIKVDVSLLVDDLRFSQGEYINVIGYLEQLDSKWIVRGVMVWPVPPTFNLLNYENAVKARIQTVL
jgi:hypothetical protein